MTTLNLTTTANDSDVHASSGATDAGKRPGLGTVSDGTLLAPGSHGSNDEYSAAVRFTNVTIPQGTMLTSALFSLRATANYDASPNVIKLIVCCQAADNAGALATSGSTDLDGATRAGTTADTTWTVTSVTGGTRYTADITTAVQEVIDRAGWASGNAIVVLIDTHADTTLNEWQDFDAHNTAGSTNGPRLDIEYSTGQLARPDADITGSPTWTGDGGETTNLYQRIDEVTASDTDYIRSVLDPSADVHEVGLETLTDPASSSDHIVRYRVRKQAAGDPVDLTVSLRQGATQIAAWTETALSTSWSTVARTLTGGEADAITDYSDLRLRFSATQDVPATAPTYVAAGTMAVTATSGATMAPGLPTGNAADDIGVLVVHTSSNVDFSDTISGWTKLSSTENNTTAQRVELWVRRFTGSGDAPTVPGITSTAVRVSRIFAVRGCPTTGNAEDHIVLARSNNAASATVTIPDATAAVANTLSVAAYCYEDDPTAATAVSGFSAWGITRTTTGADAAVGMGAARTNTTSGTKTGGTSTVSGGTFTNSVNVGLHFLFNPAPVDARANVSWAEFEVPAASAGATLTPQGLGVQQAHGTPTVTPGTVALQPDGTSNTPIYGQPTASASNTIQPSGLANQQGTGTPTVAPGAAAVQPAGLASAPAHGTPTVSAIAAIAPAGLANTPAFGQATIGSVVAIVPSGTANAPAHGQPTVAVGAVALQPDGLGGVPLYGQPTVAIGGSPATLSPGGIGNTAAHGATSVAATYALGAGGLVNQPGYGAATIASVATLLPSGLASAPAHGQPAVAATYALDTIGHGNTPAAGQVAASAIAAIAPSGIANAPAHGQPTVAVGAVTVQSGGHGNAPALGAASIDTGSLVVTTNGTGNTPAFGATSATTTNTIAASGNGNTPAFGATSVAATASVQPGGHANPTALGHATATVGAVALQPDGNGNQVGHGSPTIVGSGGPQSLAPDGSGVLQGFGSTTVATGPVATQPTGLANAPAFGQATIGSVVAIVPSGTANAPAHGQPTVAVGAVALQPDGVGNTPAFGQIDMGAGAAVVTPAGLANRPGHDTATITAVTTIAPLGAMVVTAFGHASVAPGTVAIATIGLGGVTVFGGATVSGGVSPGTVVIGIGPKGSVVIGVKARPVLAVGIGPRGSLVVTED